MSDTILNLQEAADYLKVHKRTLYRMIQNPECSIPHQRTSPRGSYRFHKAALDGWLTRSDDNDNSSFTNSLHPCNENCQEKNAVERGDLTAKRRVVTKQSANSASE